jgi:hypothetical protein
MAASEAHRPLIYAAYRDRNLVSSFTDVYDSLRQQRATVGDLHLYLDKYSRRHHKMTLFEYILNTPVASLRS